MIPRPISSRLPGSGTAVVDTVAWNVVVFTNEVRVSTPPLAVVGNALPASPPGGPGQGTDRARQSHSFVAGPLGFVGFFTETLV